MAKRPTTDGDPSAGPPTDHEPMTIENAARRLGISENAVLQRRKRGTLYGETRDGRRLVWVPVVGSVATKSRPDRSVATPSQRPTDPEVSVLAGMVDRLVRENGELKATAAVWQERAATLEQRILALESGPPPVATPDPEPTDHQPEVIRTSDPSPVVPTDRPWFGARVVRRIRRGS